MSSSPSRTGAMIDISTIASAGCWLSMSISSATVSPSRSSSSTRPPQAPGRCSDDVVVVFVVEPRVGALEQVQTHMFAPFERLGDGCVVVHVDVTQIECDAGDDRETPLRRIGD